MDQLQLPVDVVGQLLLLLGVDDVRCMRLVCQCWKQAVDHQLRVVSPLYLPPTTNATFSNCEIAQLPLLRHNQQPHAPAAATGACGPVPGIHFRWRAPVRNLDTVCSSMQHAAELDLSGQQLTADSIAVLAQHLTRLRSLKLDACKLPTAALCALLACSPAAEASGAAAEAAEGGSGLQRLSMAGVQLLTPDVIAARAAACRARRGSPRTQAATAAGAAGGSASAATASSPDGAGEAASVMPGGNRRGPEPGDARADILDVVASNPLTHLNLGGTKHMDPHVVSAADPWPIPRLAVNGYVSHLLPLSNTLVSLDVMGSVLEADDWQQICTGLTLLTELRVTWMGCMHSSLGLTAEAFDSISRLQRLQSLGVDMLGGGGLTHEPYTLTPLAQTLTSLELHGITSLPLMLSLMTCSNMQHLKLKGVTGAAGSAELVVQVASSMPLLQELELCRVEAPQLLRVGLCHLGDYLLSQTDCCCPLLSRLVMSDIQTNGTGLRIAATGMLPPPPYMGADPTTATPPQPQPAAPVPAASIPAGVGASSSTGGVGASSAVGSQPAAVAMGHGPPGSGGLRRLSHLEFSTACLMSAALLYMSCLTGLHSLTLWDMKPAAFTQACRYDCFKFVSALTNLTSLAIPAGRFGTSQDAGEAQGAVDEAAAAGAEAPGEHMANGVGSEDGSAGEAEEEHSSSGVDEPEGSDEYSSGGSSSEEDEWQEVEEGDLPEAVAPPAAPPAPPQAQLQWQQQQQQQEAAPLPPIMEPHLHFLARLKGLVGLNLGCLLTYGPCLMHLSHLTRLQTLALSGRITLTQQSLLLLQHLHLPSVQDLSITACEVELCRVPANQLSSASSSSSASQLELSKAAFSMDRLVPVLCGAFPSCVNLQLGWSDRLSVVGLSVLIQQLPELQRVWLTGSQRVSRISTAVPFNFVPCPLGLAAARRWDTQQQHMEHLEKPEGYVVPYDPEATSISDSRLQCVEEHAWFVEQGVTFQPETEAARPRASASSTPALQPSAAAAGPSSSAAAAVEGDLPEGALRLPCTPVKGLKYIELPGGRFVRYMDSMVRADAAPTA